MAVVSSKEKISLVRKRSEITLMGNLSVEKMSE